MPLTSLLGRVRAYRPGCFSWCLFAVAGLGAWLVPAVHRSRQAAQMSQLT